MDEFVFNTKDKAHKFITYIINNIGVDYELNISDEDGVCSVIVMEVTPSEYKHVKVYFDYLTGRNI